MNRSGGFAADFLQVRQAARNPSTIHRLRRLTHIFICLRPEGARFQDKFVLIAHRHSRLRGNDGNSTCYNKNKFIVPAVSLHLTRVKTQGILARSGFRILTVCHPPQIPTPAPLKNDLTAEEVKGLLPVSAN